MQVAPLAVTGATTLSGTPVALRAVDGVLAAIGPGVAPLAGDDVLDAAGDILVPGLVNGHSHAAMTLFRGFGSDLPLMEWLERKIWPAEARLTDDDVYWGTRLACVEMIRSGTVGFWDMYWRPWAVARAVADAGLRATVGPPLVDMLDVARSADACRAVEEALDAVAALALPGIDTAVAPHSIYTVSTASLEWAAATAAARGIPLELHFLETADEAVGCRARTGLGPAEYLERVGVLTADTVLAHGVWMDDDDIARVAASGATVVTNPASNMKLAVGRAFPYGPARSAGIPVGLGTDGASSNNALDLIADVRLLALLAKFAADDPAVLPAAEAWDVATGALAPALGARPLAVGEPADFLLLDAGDPALAPGHRIENVVYAASGAVVRTTVVAGRVLLRDGVVADEPEIRAKVVECARHLGVL